MSTSRYMKKLAGKIKFYEGIWEVLENEDDEGASALILEVALLIAREGDRGSRAYVVELKEDAIKHREMLKKNGW